MEEDAKAVVLEAGEPTTGALIFFTHTFMPSVGSLGAPCGGASRSRPPALEDVTKGADLREPSGRQVKDQSRPLPDSQPESQPTGRNG